VDSSSRLRKAALRALASFNHLTRIVEHNRWFILTGWLTTAFCLVVGIPLFLRMPLWCDATLYEISARNILSGGVHYRDVFDTNPPGFPWLLSGVRLFVGTGSESVRIADLLIVFAISIFLVRLARSAGATSTGIAWLAASVAAFYLFIHEFNHVQRDVWMLLPAIAAIWLRLRSVEGGRHPFAAAFLEGLLWGLGCWIKPQLLLVAVLVWFVAAGRFRSTREAVRTFIPVFSGGIVVGLLGLGWLVGTGTWPYFLDVWQNWNTTYAEVVNKELIYRIRSQQLNYFPPYSCFALLAVPLAVCNLRHRSSTDPMHFRRAVLAGTYLSWIFTTLLLQRGLHYAHVPETLLMLAVFAANRWPIPFILVLVQVLVGIFVLAATHMPGLMDAHNRFQKESWVYRTFTYPNEAFNLERTRWWADCLGNHPSRELHKHAAMFVNHFGALDPVELGAVEDYLRTQAVRDGELIAWHNSPHGLYLALDIKPSFRFMHVGTVYGLGPWQREQVLRELQAAIPQARFAVSDLHCVTKQYERLIEVGPDGLPQVLPAWQRAEFPFNQPVVFRSPSGRYLVHKISNPVTSCVIPEKLDQELP